MERKRISRGTWSAVAPGLVLAIGCGGSGSGGGSSFDGGGVVDSGHHDVTTTLIMEAGSISNNMPDAGAKEACAATSQTADVEPFDMYILLDRSGSMADNDSWTQEVQALENFIYDGNSSGIGVGLQYMPLTDLCDPAAYAAPAVSIVTLPGGQAQLATSLASSRPFGGTPTTVALEGMVTAAKARQASNPNRDIVIVLSTDGLPDTSCSTVPDGGLPNSTQNAIAVIQTAASSVPPIKTFVIGVGNQPALDAFAAAGGTGHAILVGAGDAGTTVDIEAQIISALAAIRTSALPCAYSIPQASTGNIDFSEVNVTFTPASGATQDFYGVSGAGACTTTSYDWYYDSTMTHIELCPNACAEVKAATKATVNVAYGCTTTPPPK